MWCRNCLRPCTLVRVNHGPLTRQDHEQHRDSYSDGSSCCEAETTENEQWVKEKIEGA